MNSAKTLLAASGNNGSAFSGGGRGSSLADAFFDGTRDAWATHVVPAVFAPDEPRDSLRAARRFLLVAKPPHVISEIGDGAGAPDSDAMRFTRIGPALD